MSELTDWLRRESESEANEGRFDAAANLKQAADEIERLQAIVDRLQPYEQMAQYDEQKRERKAKRDAEIAAGIRCGGGIIGCKGGQNCTFDHK